MSQDQVAATDISLHSSDIITDLVQLLYLSIEGLSCPLPLTLPLRLEWPLSRSTSNANLGMRKQSLGCLAFWHSVFILL